MIAEYSGESRRTIFQRGAEHKASLANEEEDSPLWKHCSTFHGGQHQDFTIKLIKKHHSAFQRQVHESVLISSGHRDYCLNSKAEWNGQAIPRLAIEVKDLVVQLDYNEIFLLSEAFKLL